MSAGTFEFHPLIPEHWEALVELFGSRGACGGCWCMWWRLGNKEFEKGKGETNSLLFKNLVDSDEDTGVLAFEGKLAVGWCAIAPREKFPRLDRSRTMKRIDEQPVWSIVCLFIGKEHRKRGLSSQLVNAAVDYAASRGAKIVEAYPRVLQKGQSPDVFIYTGLPQIFERAGFVTVSEPTAARRIMRKHIE